MTNVTLPDGYAGEGPDTEGVYGNPGPASLGTSSNTQELDTEFTTGNYQQAEQDTLTISHTTPAALAQTGVVSTPAQLVVYKQTLVTDSYSTSVPQSIGVEEHQPQLTLLALTTDYTVSSTGSGSTQTYSITRNNSSTACADGDTILVSYFWGNAAYWDEGVFSGGIGEYGTAAVTYGTYGPSTSGLYPGATGTVDNEHIGLLVGGSQPTYAAENLLSPPGYNEDAIETDTTGVNWPTTSGVTQNYRAPNLQIGYYGPAGDQDTTWTDRPLTTGAVGLYPEPTLQQEPYAIINGTLDSYYVGAPASLSNSADTLTINHTTPTALLNGGVVTSSVSVVTAGGHTTAQTDTLSGTSFNHTTPYALSKTGITTPAGSIVVTDTTTTHVLVSGTDYTLAASGSGATLTYTIVRINSSTNSADDNTVTVAYNYGNAAYFAPQTLVLTTDYTLATTGEGDSAVTTVERVNSSTLTADGDSVLVSYQYGTYGYYNSNLASGSEPGAPTIGSVTGQNEGVLVNWTAPTGTTPVDGYIVENSTYGTEYAPANATSMVFGGVNGHGELLPNVNYQFRVAAWNTAGVGPFSAWSSSAAALNTNAVPTGSLDPYNTTNPIYTPDGNYHSGSNLGSGGGGPRPPTSVTVTSPSTGQVHVTWAAPTAPSTNADNFEESPSGYLVALSTGPTATVLSNVLAYTFTGQASSSTVTVTVTAVGDIQSVSAVPVNVTVT